MSMIFLINRLYFTVELIRGPECSRLLVCSMLTAVATKSILSCSAMEKKMMNMMELQIGYQMI